MNLHLANADIVLIVGLSLGAALLLAACFRPKTWIGVVGEALLANIAAIAAVLAFEALIS